jgi:hypothetical protein
VLEGKRFSGVEGIKSYVEEILTETFLFRSLKTVLNSGRSAGNIVKNWKEISLKKSRLLISAALK